MRCKRNAERDSKVHGGVIMKKAIVTGANGFVGSAVVRELLAHGIQVVALVHGNHCDRLPEESDALTILPMRLEAIADLRAPLTDSDYDAFYHFAWKGSAGASRSDPRLQLANVQWTVEALKLAHDIGCRRFVGAGSIMEQEVQTAVRTQGSRPGLGYIYGGSKAAAHMLCMSVAANLGIGLVWTQITNAYGIGEVSPRMVNTTIRKVLAGEPPQFTAGTQNYDFVYIDDVARAFRLIGEKGKPFYSYLIGSGTARPLREFLLEMKAAIAPDMHFVFGDLPFTGTNLPLSAFDVGETQRDTGFRANISFAEGTKRTRDRMIEKQMSSGGYFAVR